MPSAEELLVELLECLQAVQLYLCGELNSERLSKGNERQRQFFSNSLNQLIEKVYLFDPKILSKQKKKKPDPLSPSPSLPKKPALFPPATSTVSSPAPAPAEQDEEYTEFTPNNGTIKEDDGPAELYEDMHSSTAPQDDGGELYVESEPSPAVGAGRDPDSSSKPPLSAADVDVTIELYEDPTTSAPSSGTQQSTEPVRRKSSDVVPEPPPTEGRAKRAASNRDSMMSMDGEWEGAYDAVKSVDKKVKVSDLKGVACKGMLEKLGGAKDKSWQKRFCVVSEKYMYFYESEGSKSFNNRIVVPMYVASDAPEHTNAKKKHFCFKLSSQSTSGKKDYYFRAKTEEDRARWISELKEIDAAHFAQGVAAGTSTMRIAPTQPQVLPKSIKKSSSADNINAIEEEEYQDMVSEDKDGPQEDYEAMGTAEEVEPVKELTESMEDLSEPMEEYVDVQPGGLHQPEDYEESEPSKTPPPTKTSQPGHSPITPSRSNNTLPPPPRPGKIQVSTPPGITVDTSKIYTHPPEGIQYERVYALLWDFVTSEKDEVSLKRGDLVYVSDPQPGAEWWLGELLDPDVTLKVGKKGYFPHGYAAAAFEIVV